MTPRLTPSVLTLGALFVLTSCGGSPKPESPGPQTQATPTAGADPSAPVEGSGAPGPGDATATGDASRREEISRARTILAQQVYFDFDRADLTLESRATLNAKIEVLRTHSAVTLTIAGHADERGSDEYNLALGNRRAGAVKQFLTLHGVLNGRIQTVSYGEEQPAADGHDETAWSQNRRAEFAIRSGM